MKYTFQLALLVSIMAASSVEAQTLGRLFTTPAQRAQLDRLRLQGQEPSAEYSVGIEDLEAVEIPVEEVTPNPVPAVPDQIYQLGGTLLRSDGSVQVWINGRAYDQDSLPDNVQLLQPYAQGQIRITNSTNNNSYLVRPGQTSNLTTGEDFEAYQRPLPSR
jgi:hypothetical protein